MMEEIRDSLDAGNFAAYKKRKLDGMNAEKLSSIDQRIACNPQFLILSSYFDSDSGFSTCAIADFCIGIRCLRI